MIVEIKENEFFAVHAELNQVCGMIMGVIDNNIKAGNFRKGTSIKRKFPKFCKLLDKINNEMERYAIT